MIHTWSAEILRVALIAVCSASGTIISNTPDITTKIIVGVAGGVGAFLLLFLLEKEIIYTDRDQRGSAKIIHEIDPETKKIRVVEYNEEYMIHDDTYEYDQKYWSQFKRIIVKR